MIPPNYTTYSMGIRRETNHSDPPTKRVRFAENIHIAYREAPQNDVQEAWYTKADYKRFKDDTIATLVAYRKGDLDRGEHEDEFCLDGLERHIQCLRNHETNMTQERRHKRALVLQQLQRVESMQRHPDTLAMTPVVANQ